MDIASTVIGIIEETTYIPAHITGASNLFADLGYDSLAFIAMLVRVEDAFSISFDLAELEGCVRVDCLIDTVQRKAEVEAYGGYT